MEVNLDKEIGEKQNQEKHAWKRIKLTFFGMWEMGCLYLPPSMNEFLQSNSLLIMGDQLLNSNRGACKISNSGEKNNCNNKRKRTKGPLKAEKIEIYRLFRLCYEHILFILPNSWNQFEQLVKQDTLGAKILWVYSLGSNYVLIAGSTLLCSTPHKSVRASEFCTFGLAINYIRKSSRPPLGNG